MPFTFAHPAIILPFVRSKKLSTSALVIGSMCPDFEYFLRLKIGSVYSHTFAGLFYFNLPLGLILWFIFQHIIKGSCYRALPRFLKVRTVLFPHKTRIIWVMLSLLIGALSHILWDGFTHEHGQFTDQFPWLRDTIVLNLPLYRFLQHLSTLVGFITLIVFCLKQPISKQVVTPIMWSYWMVITFVSLFFFAFFSWLMNDYSIDGNTIVRGISAFFVAWILVSWWYKKNHVPEPSEHPMN